MKARVVKQYRDKHKQTLHVEGSSVRLTQERFDELSALGYVAAEKARAKKESKPGAERQTKEDKTALDTK